MAHTELKSRARIEGKGALLSQQLSVLLWSQSRRRNRPAHCPSIRSSAGESPGIEAIHRLTQALHLTRATAVVVGVVDWSRNFGEAGDGEGSGMILLDPCGHLFADQAAQVKVFACVS
jgi:hypothetical protein